MLRTPPCFILGSPLAMGMALVLATVAGPRRMEGSIVINEVHYDPPDKTSLEEFIELYNAGASAADLSGWYLSGGVDFTFSPGTTLPAGGYLVIAESPERLRARFGADFEVLGPFDGALSGEGELITLRDALGGRIDEVDYGVGFPWPTASAGDGASMELIHPSLDNDLGGSWRASGPPTSLPIESSCMLQAQDEAWRYRKGTSEASDPPGAWRLLEFPEDESWLTGKTSIGIGDDDDNTILEDMQGAYTSVFFRHPFSMPTDAPIPIALKLRLYVDDGCIVWINGVEVARAHMAAGDKAYNAVGRTWEAKWEELILMGPSSYLHPGANILAVHAFNASLSGNDFSFDAELCVPSRFDLPPQPTPGRQNSVYSETAPPQVRQVGHGGTFPPSGAPIPITAKITDPEGVATATLLYQVVPPGGFLPAYTPHEPQALMAQPLVPPPPNPAFEDPASWQSVPLRDDGAAGDEVPADGIYTGILPPQPHRTLVRYRIEVADSKGAQARLPYADDPSLNFAVWVYDGVPPYAATKISVHPGGPGHVYPPEVLESLPVYSLITRAEDIARCVAYNGAWQIPKGNEAARDAFNWEGAFAYDGLVYDHVRYRLRQANDRYGGGGKRSWRIRFNKGNYARLLDNQGKAYPTRWRTLNTGKMFDNKGVGNFGLTEPLNDFLWNLVGVPAPHMHTFHFRVVDNADEAPAGINGQYYGDFWGTAIAIEDYDPRFLEAHKMADGNLYKLKDGVFNGNDLRRNQGRYSVTTDQDFQNIRANLRPTQTPEWLDDHVNYSRYYPYHTVVEAIRHYDFVPADTHSKNRAWYFEPYEANPLGRLWTLPWDHDASWGPNWNSGIDYSTAAIASGANKAAFRREYRNFIRAFRDLVWQEDQINAAIDERAALVAEMMRADRDRWRQAPSDAGSQDYGTMEAKVLDMKRFAFTGWTGATGPTVPAGGRAKYLDTLADAEGDAGAIPATPSVSYRGPPGFPMDGLLLARSPFSDPQGDDTFAAVEWRLSDVTPSTPRRWEWTGVWSELSSEPTLEQTIPPSAVRPGSVYRARARVQDSTGRWSHWSAPTEFIAGPPSGPIPQDASLRITELHYNPLDGGDSEFIEIENIGPDAVSLEGVRLDDGIDFDFSQGAVTLLEPRGFVVVVRSLPVFSAVYPNEGIRVAGEYSGRLDNAGERVRLSYGSGLVIQEFTYRDIWYPSTDGEGYSLVVVDPAGPREAWDTVAGWRPSQRVGGSPGLADVDLPTGGRRLPGDLEANGTLSLTDALQLLGHLFLSSPARLPCGDGTLSSAGNVLLLDGDGDGKVNLTDAVHLLQYLFLGGPAHVLGAECAPIEDCPEACP